MIKIDQVFRTRRRTLALIVKPDGSLVVRAPLRTPDLIIRAFVESKAGWIHAHQAAARANPPIPTPGLGEGQELWYLGKPYPLKVVPSAASPLSFNEAFFITQKALPRARTLLTAWYRAQALHVISQRVAWYAEQFNFSYQQVKITSAQTRWGSCSARNNLNFAWRLVMAPPDVVDYVVVHELAHTREKNHRRGFWALVRAVMPDYPARKKWLKENGGKLRIG